MHGAAMAAAYGAFCACAEHASSFSQQVGQAFHGRPIPATGTCYLPAFLLPISVLPLMRGTQRARENYPRLPLYHALRASLARMPFHARLLS